MHPRYQNLIKLTALMLGLLFAMTACERQSDAQRLLGEAEALVEQAEVEADNGFEQALASLREADRTLARLLDEHPDSSTARGLRNDSITINGHTLTQLREQHLPAFEDYLRAQQQGDLFDVALLVSKTLADEKILRQSALDIGAAIQFAGDSARALELARSFGERSPEAHALIEARLHAEAGEFEQSLEQLETIEDAVRRAVGLLMVGEQMAQTGNHDDALGVIRQADDLLPEGLRLLYFRNLARAYTQAGEYDEGLDYARRSGDYPNIADSLIEIALVLGSQDRNGTTQPQNFDAERIAAVLDEVEETIEPIENLQFRAEYLAALARAAAETGDRERATGLFDDAYKQAMEISDSRMRSESLGVVAYELADAGFSERADEVIEEAADKLRSEDQTRHIARELRPFDIDALLGRYDAAMEELLRIDNKALYIHALTTVGTAMAKQDQRPDEAQMIRLIQHGRKM